MFWVSLGFTVFFLLIGFLFLKGRGGFLVAGYNTLPKEEKERYDTLALLRFMGKCMFAFAGVTLLWAADSLLPGYGLFPVGLFAMFSLVVFMMIYANTGNRFRK